MRVEAAGTFRCIVGNSEAILGRFLVESQIGVGKSAYHQLSSFRDLVVIIRVLESPRSFANGRGIVLLIFDNELSLKVLATEIQRISP